MRPPYLPERAAVRSAQHGSHRHHEATESFGTDPERYDRARLRCPDALVAAVVAGSPGPDLLDVECGTGQDRGARNDGSGPGTVAPA
ncbi:hypothetical protein [Streptomyces pactum]|uniref:hypothetical protein n=1 Tax=Streptomyces pactum TaxID=68249 RepID=UPI003FD864A7